MEQKEAYIKMKKMACIISAVSVIIGIALIPTGLFTHIQFLTFAGIVFTVTSIITLCSNHRDLKKLRNE